MHVLTFVAVPRSFEICLVESFLSLLQVVASEREKITVNCDREVGSLSNCGSAITQNLV